MLDEESSLVPEANSDGSDFTLVGSGCWITVDNITVHIARKKTGSGIVVQVCPTGNASYIYDEIEATFEDVAEWAL